jgi:predicted CoA-substrate-specific enzyme activase
MYVAGVDVGSTATKAVILDENQQIVGRGLTHTGANVIKAAERAFAQARADSKSDDWEIGFIVGTGYGRYKVPFGNTQITEIGCHGKGAHYLFPETRTILDIGGQDTKAIKINAQGEVSDFCMNDKCAAGTGRFLEASASVIGLTLDEIGDVSMRSSHPLRITNMCTVFVESEILSHLGRGKKVEDVLRGVNNAIAGRSVALMRRVGLDDEITFTGGVSRNKGMVAAIEERLERKVNVSPDSQYIGAIGAALFAWERTQKKVGAS